MHLRQSLKLLFTPLSKTLIGAGDHTHHADFTLHDASNYSDASKNISITFLCRKSIK